MWVVFFGTCIFSLFVPVSHILIQKSSFFVQKISKNQLKLKVNINQQTGCHQTGGSARIHWSKYTTDVTQICHLPLCHANILTHFIMPSYKFVWRHLSMPPKTWEGKLRAIHKLCNTKRGRRGVCPDVMPEKEVSIWHFFVVLVLFPLDGVYSEWSPTGPPLALS